MAAEAAAWRLAPTVSSDRVPRMGALAIAQTAAAGPAVRSKRTPRRGTATPELRAELLKFFGDPNAPYATKGDPKAWAKVQTEIEQLKTAPAAVPVVAETAKP